jgi:hypothetical protein
MGLAVLEKANPNLMKPLFQRLAAVLLALLSFQVFATTHYVDVNGNNPVSPYTSWATAATNIQDAVFYAGIGDTVLVTNGIYQYGGAVNSGSNRVYVINNNITVQSVNGPAVTIIQGYQVPGTTNGANAVRCVYLNNGAILSGFTLTNGATQNFGNGGGVVSESSCIVSNCVIVGNASGNIGGGSYSANNSTLINCKIIGNIATGSGWGGGAYGCTLINCLLTGNQAGYRGGAAQNCTLINCTLANNTGQPDSIDSSKLTNCISYYNSPDNGTSSGDANVFNNCCTIPIPFSGTNIITNSPAFANLAGGDFHLSAPSPCINAGNNSFITSSTDLDGNPRIVGGTVDMGAYEFQSPVRYVSVSNTAPVSPFTNWITAATNIQDAIDAANAGDFIVVSNGVYNFGGRAVYGVATNRVVVDKAITIESVNGSASTVIAGSTSTAPLPPRFGIRCVYLTNGAVLIGFTLTNGSTVSGFPADGILELSGGGIWCESSSAVVSNCVVAGSSANRYGGGAFQGTLFNCIVTNNTASQGGGACSNILINCTLAKNSASTLNLDGGGGAIYCTLSNCIVTGNSVSPGGGGGVCDGIANNCLVCSNRAFSSGGGACSNTLINCVLKNNLADGGGGGACSCALSSCTVVSNTALNAGGGLLGGGATNSIVYYNSAPSGSNFQNSAMSFCDTTPLVSGFGNITNEPAFVNLAGGDFHLQSNSPCINSGNNAYVTSATDLDGNPRIVGGTVDIGAYEYQTPTSIISYAWLQQYGLTNNGSADFIDSDGDGMNNWQEWIAGTDPTDPLSVLQMLAPASTNNPSGLVVSWQSVNTRTYYLQSSTNLAAQPAFSTIQSNIVGQAGTTSYTDTTATNNGPYFYRVGVQY